MLAETVYVPFCHHNLPKPMLDLPQTGRIKEAANGSNMAEHIFERHPVPAAGIFGIATIPIHLLLPQQASKYLAAGTLALIGGVYVGFAVVDGQISRIILEVVIAVLFAMMALVFKPTWLVAGDIAHGLWDAAHHAPLIDTRSPRWYIPACAVYDIVTGLALFVIWI